MIDALRELWFAMLIGTAVMLVSVWAGWSVSRARRFPPVRWIGWWIDHVVIRLIRADRWSVRSLAIFVNNTSICAVAVALGPWSPAAWAGVAGVGLSLGIGLRELGERSWGCFRDERGDRSRRVAFGYALNMLEPPAIVLCLGLCLGQSALPVATSDLQVWWLFTVLAAPALAIAAMGESLWIGAVRRPN